MSGQARSLGDALEALLARGAVAATRFSLRQREALQQYAQRTGAVRLERRGAGQVFRLIDRAVAELGLRELRPMQGQDLASAQIPQRARNIGTRRNSKSGRHGHDVYHLLMRPACSGVRWTCGAEGFDLDDATAATGVAVLPVQRLDGWCSDAPLWLVENQALFDDLSWMPAGAAGTVAYYTGILDGRLLSWLTQRRRHAGLTLFADYDGVGLHQYAKLAATGANKDVEFWLMPGWKDMLATYGSATIWRDTLKHFGIASARMKGTAARHRVLELMESMQRLGLALEQESVWLAQLPNGQE